MSDIEKFTFYISDEAHDIRIFLIDDEPWWVAADVCKVLGFKRPSDAVGQHVRPGQRQLRRIAVAGDVVPEREMTVISEPGLYRLIMRSNVPGAEAFQDWVTSEVLPTIRKTGGVYVAPEVDMTDPDVLLDKLMQSAQLAKEARAELAVVKPRAVSALGAEARMDGQSLWDLRYAGADKFGIGITAWMEFCAYLGAIEERGSSRYYVRPGWDDLLFNTPTSVQPSGLTYTYANGPVRVYPGKQTEVIERLDGVFKKRMFGAAS